MLTDSEKRFVATVLGFVFRAVNVLPAVGRAAEKHVSDTQIVELALAAVSSPFAHGTRVRGPAAHGRPFGLHLIPLPPEGGSFLLCFDRPV